MNNIIVVFFIHNCIKSAVGNGDRIKKKMRLGIKPTTIVHASSLLVGLNEMLGIKCITR